MKIADKWMELKKNLVWGNPDSKIHVRFLSYIQMLAFM